MKLKEPDFAQGLLAGAEFGREVYVREERLRIRKEQRAAIKELRGTLDQTQGICAGTIERAINELDAATKARGTR